MTAMRCRPHDWATPAVGDDALTCRACGRVLDLVAELTPNMQASITAARCRVRGDIEGDAFAAALAVAIDDRTSRYYSDDTRPAHPMPEPSASSFTDTRPDRPPRGLFGKRRRPPPSRL